MYARWAQWFAALAVVPAAAALAQGEVQEKKETARTQVEDPAVQRWIRQLGSQEFKEREEAAEKLRDAGKVALPLLRGAMKDSDDPEVRWQARKLVRELEREPGVRGLRPAPDDRAEPQRVTPPGAGGPELDERFDRMFRDLERDFGITIPRGRFFEQDFFKGLERQIQPGWSWQDFQGVGKSFSMQIGPDQVRVEVKEKDADGKDRSEVYEAPDLERFREKYPEVAKKYLDGGTPGGGRFLFRYGEPGVGFDPFGGSGAPDIRVFRGGTQQRPGNPGPRTLRPALPHMGQPAVEVEPPGEGERLGVYIADVTPELRQELGLDDGVGVRVDATVEGSLAEALGIKDGDVLVSLNGKPITGPSDIRSTLKDLSDKDPVRVELFREGRKTTVKGTKGSKIR